MNENDPVDVTVDEACELFTAEPDPDLLAQVRFARSPSLNIPLPLWQVATMKEFEERQ
jgi:hypothetical protein